MEHRHGFPSTGAFRTLVDCADVVAQPLLDDLVDRALAGRVITLARLRAELAPTAGGSRRAGRQALRASLCSRGYVGGPTPSALESRMARLLAGLGIPQPAAEVRWFAGQHDREYRLDFAWAWCRLAVEVDGYSWHAAPGRMANDQRRRNAMVQAGWTLLVYTWRDVVHDGQAVGQEVTAAYRSAATAARRRPA